MTLLFRTPNHNVRLLVATQDPTQLVALMSWALVVRRTQQLTTPMTLLGPRTAAARELQKPSVSWLMLLHGCMPKPFCCNVLGTCVHHLHTAVQHHASLALFCSCKPGQVCCHTSSHRRARDTEHALSEMPIRTRQKVSQCSLSVFATA